MAECVTQSATQVTLHLDRSLGVLKYSSKIVLFEIYSVYLTLCIALTEKELFCIITSFYYAFVQHQ